MCQPTHDDAVAADELLAVDTEVLPLAVGSARGREPPGDQRSRILGPAGLHGPGAEIDGITFEPQLLALGLPDRLRRHLVDVLEKRQLLPNLADPARRLWRLERGEQLAELAQCADVAGAESPGDAFLGAEEVRQCPRSMALAAIEEQSRTACGKHAPRDLGQLERRVDFRVDLLEIALFPQHGQELTQIASRLLWV